MEEIEQQFERQRMNMHEKPDLEIYKSLLRFQSNISNIQKDASNAFFKNKYASLCNILDAINPVLIDCGLILMQHPTGDAESVTLKTILIHANSGDRIESSFSMVPTKKDPQGVGSCITYMRRYAISSILKLNVDEDDDGNGASTKATQKQYKAPERSSPLSFDSAKAHIEMATSIEALKEIASNANDIEMTSQERDLLNITYKNRIAFLRGKSNG